MALYEGFPGPGPGFPAGSWHPSAHAVVRMTGPDAVDFLQRLCSQDIAGMGEGTCRLGAFLNPKGKLLHTCAIARTAAGVWLETAADRAADLLELLERYRFTERLELGRFEGECGEVLAATAGQAANPAATPAALASPAPGNCFELPGGGIALAAARRGLAFWRFHAPAAFFAAEWPGAAIPRLAAEQVELARICAGIVQVGVDTDETTLALEADLDDHVSTSKGCYTGQEIVARIHTYGHVNRRLRLVEVLAAEPFAVNTPLLELEDGDAVGRALSSAPLPGGSRRAALATLPRDFWPSGTELRLGARGGPPVFVRPFADE